MQQPPLPAAQLVFLVNPVLKNFEEQSKFWPCTAGCGEAGRMLILMLCGPTRHDRYKKGSHPKGRNVFLKDIEPFIKWLDEADEEEEGDD